VVVSNRRGGDNVSESVPEIKQDKNFYGRRIRRLRMEQGITVGGLARRVGISRQKQTDIELHGRKIDLGLAQKFAHELNVSLDQIIEDDNNEIEPKGPYGSMYINGY
jgi:transcriptional regulator with XRE-family HTH domain